MELIDFKVYSKKYNKIFPPKDIKIINLVDGVIVVRDWDLDEDLELNIEDTEILKCTGYQDKEGNYIFEGDIVEVTYYGEYKEIGVVKKIDNWFYLQSLDSEDDGIALVSVIDNPFSAEKVVGNIYLKN